LLPPTLAADGVGGKHAAKQELARRVNPAAPLTFPDHWNQADVRGVLYASQGRVCAFCGCDLPRNDRGDVEHFRPKGQVEEDANHGGYWWLAYELNNYVLSCSLCNRVRKRDRFPLRPNAWRRITYELRRLLRTEARLLLHPEWDPVEDWLRVQWQEPLCLIRPCQDLPSASRARIQQVIDFFWLNRDVRLVRARKRVRDDVLKALDEGRANEARHLAIRFRPHSLVARQILVDRSPQHLPGPEDELQWLLNDALEELILSLELQNRDDPPDAAQERATKELLWTFAALWAEPLTGRRSDVEALLHDASLTEVVRPFFDALHRARERYNSGR
jgi:uncharacterized protein (TIGR02646 family)